MIPIPSFTHNDYLEQACEDIITLIKNKSYNLTKNKAGSATHNSLLEIATALRQTVPHPTTNIDTNIQSNTVSAPSLRVHKYTTKIGTPRLPRYQATPFKNIATEVLQYTSFLRNKQYIRPSKLKRTVVHHIYDPDTRKQENIDTLRQKYPELWEPGLSNEWGRLANGNTNGVKGTQTIEFIPKNEVPNGRDVTYASFVCDHRPLKPEPFRVRIVVGGDKLSYDNDAGSPAASLVESKLILNSTISDAQRRAHFIIM